jgi:prolyl oligopeptidase PreP (S9A serine peptidase family)
LNGGFGASWPARIRPVHPRLARSYKFAAALQAAQACANPILLRVDTDAGHGFGMPRSQALAKYADMWTFAAERLGMEVQPAGRSRQCL